MRLLPFTRSLCARHGLPKSGPVATKKSVCIISRALGRPAGPAPLFALRTPAADGLFLILPQLGRAVSVFYAVFDGDMAGAFEFSLKVHLLNRSRRYTRAHKKRLERTSTFAGCFTHINLSSRSAAQVQSHTMSHLPACRHTHTHAKEQRYGRNKSINPPGPRGKRVRTRGPPVIRAVNNNNNNNVEQESGRVAAKGCQTVC